MTSISVRIGSITTDNGKSWMREQNSAAVSEPKLGSLRRRIKVLLRDIFEGHGEYLGMTPD